MNIKLARLFGVVLFILAVIWMVLFHEYSATLFAILAVAVVYIFDPLLP